ncbi:hypothetical protein [Synechococcus sp. PCC 7336]|uniref:hypothetical protein n=1 Tax=Synechococcus sp. PCC 7336 TaxID=195250 RepID=UPI0003756DC4|nr:hypothetical protein [Synechococcus sp. PCC 7336]
MRKLDSELGSELETSWIIHIYGSNRRLLCTLEDTHAYALFIGLLLGFILGLLMTRIVTHNVEQPARKLELNPKIVDVVPWQKIN